MAGNFAPSLSLNFMCISQAPLGWALWSGYYWENLFHLEKLSIVKPWSQDWLVAAGAYAGFYSMKQLEVFLLPLNGMLVHRRSLPRNLSGFPNNLVVPIYTRGWREAQWELSVLPKNTTQCPWPGLEPGPLAPGSSAPTMRPPPLPQRSWV